MFLLFLLFASPIFAEHWKFGAKTPKFTTPKPRETKYDKFYFHTRVTCLLIQKEIYHFDIVFGDRCHNLRDIVIAKYNKITVRHQGTMFPRGDKKFTRPGSLVYNPEPVFAYFDTCRRDYNNYYVYALMHHDCTSDGRSIYQEIPITTQCKLNATGDCHVWVDIHLSGPVVRLHKVEQDP